MSILSITPSSTSPSPTSIFASISHDFHPVRLDLTSTSTAAFPTAGSSNVFPPAYESIANPSYVALKEAVLASGQDDVALRNQEKQVLRDRERLRLQQQQQQRLQLQGHAAGPSRRSTRSLPPESVNPPSGSSVYEDNGGRATVGSLHVVTPLGSASAIALVPSRSSGDSRNSSGGSSGLSSFSFGRRAILPEGMSVQEALAKCQDPALGWSLQFWITIADPVTQHVFYACPATGQTSWNPPHGVFIVPRQPDGEWWELADTSRKNRSYYYNTLTKKTQWTRPGKDHFVIPLGLIQRTTLTAPSTPARSPLRRENVGVSSAVNFPVAEPLLSTPPARPPLRPLASNGGTTSLTVIRDMPWQDAYPPGGRILSPDAQIESPESPPPSSSSQSSWPNPFPQPPVRPTLPTLSSLSTVSEVSGTDSDASDRSALHPKAMLDRLRKSSGSANSQVTKDYPYENDGLTSPPGHSPNQLGYNGPFATVMETLPESPPPVSREADLYASNGAELPNTPPAEPIHIDTSPRRSGGPRPVLPIEVTSEIQDFQSEDFATRYFAIRREGIMRQKVPLERLMSWQPMPISAPLLVASSSHAKEAITSFKVIQHVLGERDQPVESARFARDKPRPRSFSPDETSEKTVVLEEIRWMLYTAVLNTTLRDEVYCQLIKQLTKNSDHEATVLGFQLFCVLVNSFGPNKAFENYVKNFLLDNVGKKSDGIGIMAKYCLHKLKHFATRGGPGKTLSLGEIEHASDAAFYPSVFGESLDRVMGLQKASYPELKVPVILPFLADGILALGGMEAEGIFRIPGDGDSVADLKSRVDRGHYKLEGIESPHVAASLFKLWLRELEEPIIPQDMYNDALAASKDPLDALEFVKTLPMNERRVLLFVISFLQRFITDAVVEKTKMTPSNLALMLAPNILRTTSDSLVTVFTNASFESKFVLQLLEHLDPQSVDPEYVPKHIRVEGVV